MPRLIVVTGGPGAGKTSLLDALAAAGHACAPEAGRAIIQDQMAIDGPALPWRDPLLFAEQMLAWEMRSHRQAMAGTARVFFDRGMPDVIGYLRLVGQTVPPHMVRAAEKYRYHRHMFVAPPWAAIYRQDAERRQDFAEAERTFAAVTAAYADLGYALVTLPLASVAERVRFILGQVA